MGSPVGIRVKRYISLLIERFQEYLRLSLDQSLSLRAGVVYLTTVHISVLLLDGFHEMSLVIIIFLNGSPVKN